METVAETSELYIVLMKLTNGENLIVGPFSRSENFRFLRFSPVACLADIEFV
jgi:hypothetical protein